MLTWLSGRTSGQPSKRLDCSGRKRSSPCRGLAEGGSHEWACFAAHQGAEKAVTALHLYLGQEAWGHVVAKLLRELPIDVPREFVERGSVLDNFYVPARYPNGHPEGAPFEHYCPRQSKEAIEDARAIFEFVGAEMAKPPQG
jgi:HEPN domain-containing protein